MSYPSYSFDVFGRCSQCGQQTMDTASKCWYCEYQHMNSSAQLHLPQPGPHTCPTCSGTGKVSRPPWLPGDVNTWTDNGTGKLYECQSCGGHGILWK